MWGIYPNYGEARTLEADHEPAGRVQGSGEARGDPVGSEGKGREDATRLPPVSGRTAPVSFSGNPCGPVYLASLSTLQRHHRWPIYGPVEVLRPPVGRPSEDETSQTTGSTGRTLSWRWYHTIGSHRPSPASWSNATH